MNLHKLELNEIRGFGRKKPLLLIPFLLAAMSIGGIPGFSGYVSKRYFTNRSWNMLLLLKVVIKSQ